MLTAPLVILILKIAVAAVTVLLLASLIALALGKYHLHGRINLVFFLLTETALLGLEVIARLIDPNLFKDFFDATDSWTRLKVHLCFSIPSAILLPILLFTGIRRHIWIHYPLALFFLVLWIGTFITGIFFLPHALPE